MSRYNRDKGLRALMKNHRTPGEVKSDELQKFYKDHIEDKKPIPRVAPEEDTLDYIPTPLSTPLTTEEPKNKFGHTASQKNKMIMDQITRPPDNIKKMVEKNMPILTYVDKMNTLYGGQKDRKYDDKGYPLEASPDQMQGLEKRLKNARQMTSPNKPLNKPKLEGYKHVGALERLTTATPEVDEYGNVAGATDRIRQQDEDRKKIESEKNKNKNKGRFR